MVDKRHRKEWHAHLRPTCLRTSVDHDRDAINAALTRAITLWIFCPSSLDCTLKILFNTWAGQCQWAVSMGGSNELVECFCGGAVAEGCSGAVARLVGDGVEGGLVAGDGGSFGQVAADKSVGVFVGSSLPGAVGVSEEHLHAGVVGEALVAGHFPSLVPCQCSHRSFG